LLPFLRNLMDLDYHLRFPESELRRYQELYDFKTNTRSLEKYYEIGPKQGHLTINQLAEIVDWKSERRPELVWKNDPALVIELTSFAFRAQHPTARMGNLTLLTGVGMPTASVISHYCLDPNDPIIDERAIWSLGLEQPSYYTFEFWAAYVAICRELAMRNHMTVREIDMALWKYSEINQGGLSGSKQGKALLAGKRKSLQPVGAGI
jgi:hypothetical protein